MLTGRRIALFIGLLVFAGLIGGGAYLYLQRPSFDDVALGKYEGNLIVKVLDDGRLMEVMEPFGYVDGRGEKWEVPKGSQVDGASIPQGAWTFIGGPFEGKYRNASVVHDVYCENRSRNWELTHKVFYEAMLASGVDKKQAQLMFYAVYRYGPRWENEQVLAPLNHSAYPEQEQTVYEAQAVDTEDLKNAAAEINRGGVSLNKLATDAMTKRAVTDKVVCKDSNANLRQNCGRGRGRGIQTNQPNRQNNATP